MKWTRPLFVVLLSSVGLAQTPTTADVPYASPSSLDAQKLDVYVPAGAGPFDVVMLLNGGGLSGTDRAGFIGDPITQNVLSRGWAAVAPSYRRVGPPMWPTDLHDVKAAVRWLHANHVTYNLTDVIVVYGLSGGGRLASLVATTAGIAAYDGTVGPHTAEPTTISGAVSMYAPLDFTTIYQDEIDAECSHNPNTADILGCVPGGATYGSCLAIATEASPALQTHAGSAPVLVMTGDDHCRYWVESDRLRANVAATGSPNGEVKFIGGAHGTPHYFTYYSWQYMFRFFCAQGVPSGCTRTFQ
jgi:acetyl esterase/lipase